MLSMLVITMTDTYTPLTSGTPVNVSGSVGDSIGYVVTTAYAQMILAAVAATTIDVAIFLKYGTPFASLAAPFIDAPVAINQDPVGGGESGSAYLPAGTVYLALYFFEAGDVTLTATATSADVPTAWVNAFDAGACTVVIFQDANQIFSQSMSKGDSVTFGSDYVYTIAVSAAGVVTLSGNQIGGGGGHLYVSVVSAQAPSALRRAKDMTIDIGTAGTEFATVSSNTGDENYVTYALTGNGGVWTPDPCIVAPATGVTVAGNAGLAS